ncbi:Ubiquitin fusion degradation protein 4 [Thoreauomyces humboldtii]|nr:Ubiquitin fusion degradation protein 4 [Thoreauomyces humboldtii]
MSHPQGPRHRPRVSEADKVPSSASSTSRRRTSSDLADDTVSAEPPSKRQRKAAVKALEGIASIANSGRRTLRSEPAMGKDGKSRGSDGDGEEAREETIKPSSMASSEKKGKANNRRAKKADSKPAATKPTPAQSRSAGGSKRGRTAKSQGKDVRPSGSSGDSEDQGGLGHTEDDYMDEDSDELDGSSHPGPPGPSFTFDSRAGGGSAASGRFAEMLRQMKQSADPTTQMIALQELSEILSMATEDMFIGHGGQRMAGFSTDEFVKALVGIIKGGSPQLDGDVSLAMLQEMGMTAAELGLGTNDMLTPELMLLACRCLSNLIEAHPSSTMHVLQHGAVQVLVEKLMEVEYIDLAEQVLSVLDKISVDYPSAILKANGLLAVLQYIDFFGLHVQRTAVTIAANACQGLNAALAGARRLDPSATIGADGAGGNIHDKVREVVPILERLLSYGDNKIVEQTVRALDRIVDWSWKNCNHLEGFVSISLLKTIVTIIDPNGGQDAGGAALPSVFAKLVKLVTSVAKGSPTLGTYLITDLGIVDVIKNYLTGGLVISDSLVDAEETDMETISTAVTEVVVTRPADQVLQVIRLASAVLPSLPSTGIWEIPSATAKPANSGVDSTGSTKTESAIPDPDVALEISKAPKSPSKAASEKNSSASRRERRLHLLEQNPTAVRRYSTLLLPIFIEVFGVTVNPDLRRTIVECLAKGIWHLQDPDDLAKALKKNKVFGKFVPELLSLYTTGTNASPKERKESLVLVAGGIQIALVVLDRCGDRFAAWFAREGALREMERIVAEKSDDNDAGGESSDAAHEPAADATSSPFGNRMNDLVNELRKLQGRADGGSSGYASLDARRAQVDELLRTVEAMQQENLSLEADEGSSANGTKKTNDAEVDASATDKEAAAGKSSAESAVDSGLLGSMRSFMDRLERSDDHSSSRPKTASGGDITMLNGTLCREKDVKVWVVDNCRKLATDMSSSSSENQGDVLSQLRALAKALRDQPSTVRELLAVLQQVAQHFAGTTDMHGGIGVTGYEMLESGVMLALTDVLAGPASVPSETSSKHTTVAENLKAFLHVFMNGPTPDPAHQPFHVPGALKRLVQALQECLSRVEQFEVAVGVPSPSADSRYSSLGGFGYGISGAQHRETSNPSLQLTRQLRVQLVAEDPKTVPAQYQALLISVHAVATYKALEDYLKGRVVMAPGLETRSESKTGVEELGLDASKIDEDKIEEDDLDEDFVDEDDGEDDMDEDVMNVSDLLLESEEASRNRRRRESVPDNGKPEDAAATSGEAGAAGAAGRRDSVIDVRTETPTSTPARPATRASSSAANDSPASQLPPKVPSTPAAAPLSYASAAAASTNFNIEFKIGEMPLPRDMTIFGSVYQSELTKNVQQPNVWGKVFTVSYKKVWPGQKESIGPDVPPASGIAAAPDASACSGFKVPFSKSLPEGVSLDRPDGQVLYLLRILYSLNSRWAEVYANEDLELDGVHAGGSTALALQEGSQPLERVANTSRTDAPVRLDALPAPAFTSTKLTAKLNRQLDEPLIVASDVLPSWCSLLTKSFPFLVPFDTRLVYLQSTSFGYSRSMGRWQQQQQQGGAGSANNESNSSSQNGGGQQLGRIQRQKVRIARERILDSMVKVVQLYGSTQALLEVEFFDEVGTGLGPTLEFYSSVCRAVRERGGSTFGAGKPLKLWRSDDAPPPSSDTAEVREDFLNPSLGFFPAPLSASQTTSDDGKRTLSLFQGLGTFVAKALLDSRMVDLPFSPIFLEMVVGEEEEEEAQAEAAMGRAGRSGAEFHLLRHVDPSLYKSLLDLKKYVHAKSVVDRESKTLSPENRRKRLDDITIRGAHIEDLSLDFTLPGYPDTELLPDGRSVDVTLDNVEEYIDSVVEHSVGTGVTPQIEAFRKGFDLVFPSSDLRSFTVQELAVLVGGTGDDGPGGASDLHWSASSLKDAVKADHGYNSESATIAHLLTYMAGLDRVQRREFLQFVTGSPKLPIGGFSSLTPPLTVVRKTVEASSGPDAYLPSVMTCVNYLKVPDYSSFAVMKARFDVAVREGQGCFHLS